MILQFLNMAIFHGYIKYHQMLFVGIIIPTKEIFWWICYLIHLSQIFIVKLESSKIMVNLRYPAKDEQILAGERRS